MRPSSRLTRVFFEYRNVRNYGIKRVRDSVAQRLCISRTSCFFLSTFILHAHFQGILGLLFQNKSVGLFEDLPEFDTNKTLTYETISDAYNGTALRCYAAAAVYAVLLIVSSARVYMLVR